MQCSCWKTIVECYVFIAFTISGKHTLNASFSSLRPDNCGKMCRKVHCWSLFSLCRKISYEQHILPMLSNGEHRVFHAFSKTGWTRNFPVIYPLVKLSENKAFIAVKVMWILIPKSETQSSVWIFLPSRLITEVLYEQLRVKISGNNFEWRFDDSFIIFKF